MKNYLLAIDSPDPDNLVLVRLAQNLLMKKGDTVNVLLTGRPINFDTESKPDLETWNYDHSRMALTASAARLKNFLRSFDSKINVFDGGIAPRTLVPHHFHFQDYYKFLDIDPLRSIAVSELDNIELLADEIKDDEFTVLVGGPMTGLANLIQRFPKVADNISEVHAMYASLGTVKLLDLGDAPRGAKQFNVACDPFSGKYVVDALDCPIYFITSDCTREDKIAFDTPYELRDLLKDNPGNRNLINLYNIWYANAVEPRGDKIFIHDVCVAISASEHGRKVYDFTPMEITRFPTLPAEKEDWGVIEFKENPRSNLHVSTKVKNPALYKSILREQLY